ncbi:hypothetical protein, partial [Burkholderia sp.]|uniref:hypothetical protein n=1 Tax=Burkholderia sp. TaxID=36773 RepID=UPI00258AC6D4
MQRITPLRAPALRRRREQRHDHATRHRSRGAACVARMAMRRCSRRDATTRPDGHLAAKSLPLVYSASQHCALPSPIGHPADFVSTRHSETLCTSVFWLPSTAATR